MNYGNTLALDSGRFFCSVRALECCRSLNKTVNFENRKNIRKKKFISGDKKHFSSLIFLLVVLVAFVNLNRSKVFLISSPSLTFLKIGLMSSFLKCFFPSRPLLHKRG